MEELKDIIASRYDPLQLMDVLGIEMEDLVELLWDKIDENQSLFEEELGEIYDDEY